MLIRGLRTISHIISFFFSPSQGHRDLILFFFSELLFCSFFFKTWRASAASLHQILFSPQGLERSANDRSSAVIAERTNGRSLRATERKFSKEEDQQLKKHCVLYQPLLLLLLLLAKTKPPRERILSLSCKRSRERASGLLSSLLLVVSLERRRRRRREKGRRERERERGSPM